jgi:hypothetical protein
MGRFFHSASAVHAAPNPRTHAPRHSDLALRNASKPQTAEVDLRLMRHARHSTPTAAHAPGAGGTGTVIRRRARITRTEDLRASGKKGLDELPLQSVVLTILLYGYRPVHSSNMAESSVALEIPLWTRRVGLAITELRTPHLASAPMPEPRRHKVQQHAWTQVQVRPQHPLPPRH